MNTLKRQKLSSQAISAKATHGVAWLIGQTFVSRGVTLIGQLVLAKLLMPEDFGVLGLATTISTIFGLLSNLGADLVLQQRSKRIDYWATQVFWISLMVATVSGLVMSLFAPWGAMLYGNEKIISLVWVLAVGFPFQALVTVPQVKLQAQLRFEFLASYNAAEVFMTQVLTILLAWTGVGALSFVIPVSALAIVKAVVFWCLAPVSLRPWRKVRGWIKMVIKCLTILGGRISTTLISQGDYITLGLLAPANVVGAYLFAFKLAVQPTSVLSTNFANVLLPTLVALEDEPQKQRDMAFKASSFLCLLTTPLCLAMAAIAEPFLTFLFGDRWSASIPYIQILSFGLPLDAMSWLAGSYLDAKGLFFRKSMYMTFALVFFYFVVGMGGVWGSALGVAMAVSIYYVIFSVVFASLIYRREGIKVKQLLFAFSVPYLLSLLSIGSAYMLSRAPVLSGHYVLQIIVILGVGGLTYIAAVRLFLPHIYHETLWRIRTVLQRGMFAA